MPSRLQETIEAPLFRRTVVGLILFNALVIGLETYPDIAASYGTLLNAADRLVLWLFTVELALRWAAAPGWAFFRDPWHWLDMAVVATGYVPGSRFFTVIRLFRILRVLRALTVLPNLQRLANALLRGLPLLGDVLVLLGILFYVYGTAGTFLYRAISPDYFGSLHQSMLTLFQIITLEEWAAIMRTVRPAAPGCWLYFVSFILLGTFVALNSLISVILRNLEALDGESALDRIERKVDAIASRLPR